MRSWSEFWPLLIARLKESVYWLSVQVMAGWGLVWVIYSQLPADVMTQLAQMKFFYLSVPAWMGILQTGTTYMARVKPPKQVQ